MEERKKADSGGKSGKTRRGETGKKKSEVKERKGRERKR